MSEANWPWFHRNLGRMETERLLVESRTKDGSFLIRPSESMKGAYVLSLIHQQRIHHYRILPNDDSTLSVQAQEGVQQKRFQSLDELVGFYSQPKRGIVCSLATPIEPLPPAYEELEQQDNDEEDEDDDEDVDPDYDNPDDEVTEKERLHSTISKYLLAALANGDLSSVEYEFQDKLKQYLSSSVATDIENMASSTPQLTYLKQLINKEVENTHKQLDKLMTQLDCLQSLLDRVGGAKQGSQTRRSSPQDSGYDTLTYKLNDCASAVSKLETTAFSTYKDLGVRLLGAGKSSLTQPASFKGVSSLTDEVSFDVKLEQQLGGKKNVVLCVRLKDGNLVVCKQGEASSLGQVYQHHQVSQLIKSRSKVQKLGILFDGRNRKDYAFASMQAREHFCQLIQTIRNKQRTYEDPDSISVFVGCWNMGDSAPPNDITSWFKSEGWGRTEDNGAAVDHDIYAIGTQESSMGEREWVAKIKSILKGLFDVEYERVSSQTLWGIRLLILIKQEHMKKLSHVEHSQVRTGIGNTLGNKGAVAISLYFNNISMAFINAHLTSGTEKCHRRNLNYHDILKGMATLKHKHISQFDLTHQFNHLFFFGDLNYRVELDSKEIIQHAKSGNLNALYCSDQLRSEMEKKKVFVGFEEAPIMFPPTYRFRKGERTMDSYVYLKKKRSGDRINEPSFCDRVLWKSYPGSRITNTTYGCTNNVTTSDHSPVFCTFRIGGFKQYASDKASSSPNTFIILKSCSARILTNSRTTFYIELYSACFQGVMKTEHSKDFTEARDGSLHTVWGDDRTSHLVKITPVMTEQDYLEQQHVLLMIKSTDSDEPYAECCIALGSVIGPTPQKVSRELIHQGLSVGELDCDIHVTMDHYKKTAYDPEKDLYGNLDFIRQDLELEDSTSMDTKGSRSIFYTHANTTARSTSTHEHDSRPPLPIPRSGSVTGSASHQIHSHSSALFSTSVPLDISSSLAQRPPMPLPTPRSGNDAFPPLPRRRETPPGPSRPATTPTAGARSFPPAYSDNCISESPVPPSSSSPQPPVVPSRRGNNSPVNSSRPPIADKPRISNNNSTISGSPRTRPQPPVPARRTRLSGESPPLSRAVVSAQSAISPTPSMSSVEEFLAAESLQQYANQLIENGYDHVKYLRDITDTELKEVNVNDERDRRKLLKLFKTIPPPAGSH